MAIINMSLKKWAKVLDNGVYLVQLCFAWVLFRVLGLQEIQDNAGSSVKSVSAEVSVDPVARGQLAR